MNSGRSTIVAPVILLGAFLAIDSQAMQAQTSAGPKPELSPFCALLPEPGGLEPSKKNQETVKERAYYASVSHFSQVWCDPGKIGADVRLKAVDSMVAAWKLFWDEDPPFSAEFHEQGASDLLVLMGITRELPKQMRDDPEFVLTWIERCKDSCFTIWGDPANRKDQAGILLQLQLWGDVLHHLKQEPATEPIFDMLRSAQFRMVD
jgi:hypothetical protein